MDLEMEKWIEQLPFREVYRACSISKIYPDEKIYDERHCISKSVASGSGLIALLDSHGIRTDFPILELGCGTGELSIGLAHSHHSPLLIMSDNSEFFLKSLKRTLGTTGGGGELLLLNFEDLCALPSNSLSVICMKAVLHHVNDMESFCREANRLLVKGGCIVFEEPFAEGYRLIGGLMRLLPQLIAGSGLKLTIDDVQKIEEFCNCIIFYSRHDIDKSSAEDKIFMEPERLSRVFGKYGFTCQFFVNNKFSDFSDSLNGRSECVENELFEYFRLYLWHIMGFGEKFANMVMDALHEPAVFINRCAAGGMGPAYAGVGLLIK